VVFDGAFYKTPRSGYTVQGFKLIRFPAPMWASPPWAERIAFAAIEFGTGFMPARQSQA
jgi:hypothetical protein